MKLVIDIPDDIYKIVKDEVRCEGSSIGYSIKHGTHYDAETICIM